MLVARFVSIAAYKDPPKRLQQLARQTTNLTVLSDIWWHIWLGWPPHAVDCRCVRLHFSLLDYLKAISEIQMRSPLTWCLYVHPLLLSICHFVNLQQIQACQFCRHFAMSYTECCAYSWQRCQSSKAKQSMVWHTFSSRGASTEEHSMQTFRMQFWRGCTACRTAESTTGSRSKFVYAGRLACLPL